VPIALVSFKEYVLIKGAREEELLCSGILIKHEQKYPKNVLFSLYSQNFDGAIMAI
jgi:hypothetical protein